MIVIGLVTTCLVLVFCLYCKHVIPAFFDFSFHVSAYVFTMLSSFCVILVKINEGEEVISI